MVGHNQVEPERLGRLCRGEGADAGIDADDQAHPVGSCALQNLALHAVALAQAMRYVEAHGAPEHLNRGLEQHHGGCTVDIVVAVDQDGFARGNRGFDARDGRAHAQHRIRVEQVIEVRVQIALGSGRGRDAAGHQKRGDHQGDLHRPTKLGG
jgi:hypothetical protein